MIDGFKKDLRYGMRDLARHPGFTLVASLSLALGIGANSAIFTMANAVFLNPLPIHEPSRVLELYTVDHSAHSGAGRTPVSFTNYQDFRDQNDVFSGLAGFYPTSVTLVGTGDPKPQPAMLVTANYFQVLGVEPMLGRTFAANEDAHLGGDNVTVLSHALWVRAFGAERSIVGRQVSFNATAYTVIGVMPPGFKGTLTVSAAEVAWIPISMHSQVITGALERLFNERRSRFLSVVGRLKPGFTAGQALSQMRTIATRLEKEYPEPNKNRSVDVSSVMDAALSGLPRQQLSTASLALLSVAGLILLIASANVANLLLARSGARAGEFGIRVAIGASRGRIIRQLLTESMLLSSVGGVFGLGLGVLGVRLLWLYRPPFIQPDSVSFRLDLRVVAFTLIVTTLTGVLFGLAPALRAFREETAISLRSGGRSRSQSRGEFAFGNALVIGEISLALTALAGAGLFIRSMQNAQKIDVGFEARNLAVFSFNLAARNYSTERAQQFLKTVEARVAGVPGVRDVAIATLPPLTKGILGTVISEGSTDPNDRGTPTVFNSVTPPYFKTLGIRLEAGRFLNDFDRADTKKVAVINRAMERYYWPGENAVGKRWRFFRENFYREVVGVVADSVVLNVGEPPQPVVYLPLEQEFSPSVTVDVRTTAAPEALVSRLVAEVNRLDPNLAVTGTNTISELITQGLWAPRMGAALFVIFGLLASVLTAIGIYGVISNMVSRRTSEIGIRMALGADAGDMLWMVVRQTIQIAVSGIGIGLLLAFGLGRLTRSLLFNLSPNDPLTFVVVGAGIAAIALLAGSVPASRAARIDPATAMRSE